jgi:hypothetical protein
LPLPAVATTDDPELCIVVNSRCFAPIARDGGRYTFVVPAHADTIRLRSRHVMPVALRPWLDDTRRLGVAVHRISVRRGLLHSDIALDDPSLTDGWWDVECDAATMWRWTDGDVALPCAGGPAVIELLIGGTLRYELDEPMPARQGDPGVVRKQLIPRVTSHPMPNGCQNTLHPAQRGGRVSRNAII